MNYTVDFPVTLALAKQHLMAMVTGRPTTDPTQPARDWCDANLTGSWSSDAITRTLYTNNWTVVFRFERQEDAALFKLFHGGA